MVIDILFYRKDQELKKTKQKKKHTHKKQKQKNIQEFWKLSNLPLFRAVRRKKNKTPNQLKFHKQSITPVDAYNTSSKIRLESINVISDGHQNMTDNYSFGYMTALLLTKPLGVPGIKWFETKRYWFATCCTRPLKSDNGCFFFYKLRPRQNGCHFVDDISKCIFFWTESAWISINISLKFVPKGSINNIPALVQIMAWRRPGYKPLSEPMILSLLTHIYASLGLNELMGLCEITYLIMCDMIYGTYTFEWNWCDTNDIKWIISEILRLWNPMLTANLLDQTQFADINGFQHTFYNSHAVSKIRIMPETCENWLVYTVLFTMPRQTREIYQVLPYSVDY